MVAFASCGGSGTESEAAPGATQDGTNVAQCESPEVAAVVEALGERLRQVSVLAPDSILLPDLQRLYGPLVTPELLRVWVSDPRTAPGREVSSPWPQRIDIIARERTADEACRVTGEVAYVTGPAAAPAEVVHREQVVLELIRTPEGWRISDYDATAAGDVSAPDDGSAPDDAAPRGDAQAAAAVLRRYYDAISAGDYRVAYALWSDDGASSGQSFDEFAAGYAQTEDVALDVGAAGRIGAAAGSRYITIPVTIRAHTASGEAQRFEGSYTLHRSVVDGATPAQRSWRIYSAELEPVGPR